MVIKHSLLLNNPHGYHALLETHAYVKAPNAITAITSLSTRHTDYW